MLASDEYEEFSDYNDAIGMFINEKNIAVINNWSWRSVTTSTINKRNNWDYYISNTNGSKNN